MFYRKTGESSTVNMETEIEGHLLWLPDEILVSILNWIPKLELFWCAGLACQKLFVLSCEILNNTIELREAGDNTESKNIISELRQADRLEEVFRRNEILNCITHIIVPSYSHNCLGMLQYSN